MNAVFAWAGASVRQARWDAFRNAWLWLGPMLVMQQVADRDRPGWMMFVLPVFGYMLGRAVLGRGITPGGAQPMSPPTLLLPITARQRVAGGILGSILVAGGAFLLLRTIGALFAMGLDVAIGRDEVRGLGVDAIFTDASIGLLATLPLCALSFAPPAGRDLPYAVPLMGAFVGLAWLTGFPALAEQLPVLLVVSASACLAAWWVAPAIERIALSDRGLPVGQRVRRLWTASGDESYGAPSRAAHVALLSMNLRHAARNSVFTVPLLLAVAAFVAADGAARSLPPVLLVVATMMGGMLPTTPLAARSGTVAPGFATNVLTGLPVTLPAVWWTGLAAGAAQTLALVLTGVGVAVAVVNRQGGAEPTDLRFGAAELSAMVPGCLAVALLLRVGLGGAGPASTAARIVSGGCGFVLLTALPIASAIPMEWWFDSPALGSTALLVATLLVLVALTPRSPGRE